jgi:hypothetical protein
MGAQFTPQRKQAAMQFAVLEKHLEVINYTIMRKWKCLSENACECTGHFDTVMKYLNLCPDGTKCSGPVLKNNNTSVE